ncbi:multicopper oxidase-domain-containing protein [Lactarius quietus]|nr:multicopper oxidase-domain-containing protein [Lactarius quietus]
MLYALALLLPAVQRGVHASIGPIAKLDIVNQDISPDGYPRPNPISATLAGDTFPGPIIRGRKWDTFSINVTDYLMDTSMNLATSIHWHGIFQKGTNYVDGVASVTQCPLVPEESFLYEFNVFDQTGTYWYHSHFKNQYCDGLRGALIIEDPDDPQRYLYDIDDDSTVISLADWYHYVSTVAPPIPAFNSTLINGKGNYPGNPSSNVELAVVHVQRGLRYRFRVVSMSCDPSFNFSIDGHKMTVIEVDGNNVTPLQIDSLQIFAAQRYSVVVEANQPVGNYWIRSLPNAPGQNFSNLNNLAVLRYAGAAQAYPPCDPTVNISVSQMPLVETNLHVRSYDIVTSKGLTCPCLAAHKLSCCKFTGFGSFTPINRTIRFSPEILFLEALTSTSTWKVRDVVGIGNPGDNVTIRFFTDNPGPWFFHCHIDWHLGHGFAVVFAEDVPDVPKEDITTAAWENLCPIYDNFVSTTGHT